MENTLEDHLVELGSVDDSEMWEWSITAAFIDPRDGRFRVASDSGCSCNGPWAYFTDADYGPPLTAKEACAEIMSESPVYRECVTDFRADCLKVCDAIKKADKAWSRGEFREEDFG